MNEFEQRLRQVPMKPIPPAWRPEVLVAAGMIQPSERGVDAVPSIRTRLTAGWRSLFWPHPRAWAGLAAVWVIIAMMHFSQPNDSPLLAEKFVPPTPDMLADLRQQHQMLVELLGPPAAGEADRPKKAAPHTQLTRTMSG